MIAIHPIHRRMAELVIKSRRVGGFGKLSYTEALEIEMCLLVNADIVQKLDSLKELAFHAHEKDDFEWEMDICRQIDQLEASML